MATDILLTNSYYLSYESMPGAKGQPYPPLGILYLAAYLRKNSHYSIDIFDPTFSNGLDDFRRVLNEKNPVVVGIQSVITTRIVAQKMIKIAHDSGARVVVGGPDPSSCYIDYLQWGADIVVIGEGEYTLYELLPVLLKLPSNMAELAKISGLAYHQDLNGEMKVNITTARPPIINLDEIPYPAYDMIDIPQYLDAWKAYNGYSSMHIATSRGCPYQCVWCSHTVFGSTYRQRSVENVVGEMKYLSEIYHPDHITIADDTLGINKKWIRDWREKLQSENIKIPFRCFSRANLINEEMLGELKLAGCRHIYLGVETGSQKILDSMTKGITVDQIQQATKLIKSYNIDIGFFIMFAFPGESYSDIKQTLDIIFELKPNSLGMSIAYPIPGTPFYEKVQDKLLPSKHNTEETMGSSRELKFRATYPLRYYLALIRYIDLRRQKEFETTNIAHKAAITLQSWFYWVYIVIYNTFTTSSKGTFLESEVL